jgi:diguanylate cyclase (GGDEF)-like protein
MSEALDRWAQIETPSRVLEMIFQEEKIEAILDELERWVESQIPGGQCRVSRDLLRDTPVSANNGLRAALAYAIKGSDHILCVRLHDGSSVPDEYERVAIFASELAAIAIRQQARLEVGAQQDPLTGLLNRSRFQEILGVVAHSAWASSSKLTVLFLGLDRFKQVNDLYGHASGDRLLAEVGRRLQAQLGEGEYAGRMGGDEFAVLLCGPSNQQESEQAAIRILEALRVPHQVSGQELGVSASCGVSLFPQHSLVASGLLEAADKAMSQVKRHGGNHVSVFAPGNQPKVSDRLHLEHGLGHALGNDEFKLVYQPLVNMQGKLDGMEALLVWSHPQRGRIAPKDFIPVAEETGLIVPIGAWVLREACIQGARWLKTGHPGLYISVNVSAVQFERDDFVDTVAAALAESQFPAARLELEVTESFVMRDVEAASTRMAALRGLGIRIAIDDFGTGYSSLSYLNRLPVDTLKIDQSFVRTIQDPSGSLQVVQTIVRLAHNLNLLVVAEGVETVQELELLRLVGCDKVQGHLYGYALNEHGVDALLLRPDGTVAVRTSAAAG